MGSLLIIEEQNPDTIYQEIEGLNDKVEFRKKSKMYLQVMTCDLFTNPTQMLNPSMLWIFW